MSLGLPVATFCETLYASEIRPRAQKTSGDALIIWYPPYLGLWEHLHMVEMGGPAGMVRTISLNDHSCDNDRWMRIVQSLDPPPSTGALPRDHRVASAGT